LWNPLARDTLPRQSPRRDRPGRERAIHLPQQGGAKGMRPSSASVLSNLAALAALLLAVFPAAGPGLAAPRAAGGSLTVAMSQEPDTLGYGLGNLYVNSVVKFALGSEPTLTRRNDKNEWFPYLATSTPLLENGGASFVGDGADQRLQVEFDMRQDVKWSDGVPVTAKDVQFAWQLEVNPDYPIPDRTQFQKIAFLETSGDYHVSVGYMSQNEARDAAANGRLGLDAKGFADFANQEGPVLDPAYYKGYPAFPRHVLQPLIDQVGVATLAQQDIMRKPLGVGPFRVTDWAPGQAITTEAVSGYFLGQPRLQAVQFKLIPDTNALLAQLANGDVDMATEDALNEFNAPDLDQLEKQGKIKAYYTPSSTWEHIDLNLDNKFLSDLRVRQAITYGINRQQIVDRVLNGKTTVIHSWAPAQMWWYSADVTKYDYNPAKARELLAQAGYTPGPDGIMRSKDGQKLSLKYQTTAQNKARELVTQIVQQNLKDVGIEAVLDYVPSTQYFSGGQNPGPLTGRTFEMGEYAWVAGDDPNGTKNLYSSAAIPSKDNSYVGQNYAGFRNPRNDELLQGTENTLDRASRQAMYAEEQKIWTDNLPVIPLYARANVTAVTPNLKAFRPTPTNTPPTWNAHEWELG
jgi:peptide/nickel transport system substrate-binding protein